MEAGIRVYGFRVLGMISNVMGLVLIDYNIGYLP